ncbi:hypothetical protein I6U06_24570 [Klebsiella pneumoniae]|nr:hypothetical protein [Klebsiella pneumoniae]
MTLSLRTRDPGLQPERTALAAADSVFGFVLALASTRFGFARGDRFPGIAGIALG